MIGRLLRRRKSEANEPWMLLPPFSVEWPWLPDDPIPPCFQSVMGSEECAPRKTTLPPLGSRARPFIGSRPSDPGFGD